VINKKMLRVLQKKKIDGLEIHRFQGLCNLVLQVGGMDATSHEGLLVVLEFD
jgi:hypothetical protein